MKKPKLFQEKHEWLAADNDKILFAKCRLNRKGILEEEVKRGEAKKMHLEDFKSRSSNAVILLKFLAPKGLGLSESQIDVLEELYSEDGGDFEVCVLAAISQLRSTRDTYLLQESPITECVEILEIMISRSVEEGAVISFFSDWEPLHTPVCVLYIKGMPIEEINFEEYKKINPYWNYGQPD